MVYCSANSVGKMAQESIYSSLPLRKLKDEIMYQIHESLLSGHLGKCKTREQVIQHFYWFGVREDCDLWVGKCDICASVKKPPQNPRAPLGQMPIVGALINHTGNRYPLVLSH